MTNNEIITISKFQVINSASFFSCRKYKYCIFIGTGFIIGCAIVIIILFSRETTTKVLVDEKNITGKYLCNIDSPQKQKLKVKIFKDSLSNTYWGQFINYNYECISDTSSFSVNSEMTEIDNKILGQGTIIENSMGEIEINSKPKNEKKWNMRKIQ